MDSIQPQEIGEILEKHGTHVNAEEAKLILQFMSMIANMALDVYLEANTIKNSFSIESVNQNSE